MKPLFIAILYLLFTAISINGYGQIKLDQTNRNSTFYKKASNVALLISKTAYNISDTLSLKIVIDRINEVNCANNDWLSILNKLHYEINILEAPNLSIDKMGKHCDSVKSLSKYDSENHQIIKDNIEVLSLLKDGIIQYDLNKKHFSTRIFNSFIDLLYYGNISNGQKIADIGCGINTLGIFAGILYPESKIYSTEIDSNLLKYSKSRLNVYDNLISQENFNFIISDSTSINVKEPVDWIIFRKTVHHLLSPNEFLQSTRKILNKNGRLLIFEALPSRKKKHSQCKKLMKKRAILRLLKRNEFKLLKKRITRKNLYLIYH